MAVTESKEVKVLWDFEIRSEKVIPEQRLNIVANDKTKRTTTVIHVAVPEDLKVNDKEDKILKYQDLIIEIQKLWNTKAKVVSFMMGSLVATSRNI